jgi:hypothetical protein
VWWIWVEHRDIAAAFGSISVDVDTLDDAGATPISSTGVESFEDFSACGSQRLRQALRGKNPPGW